jgi:hypothetical protein
MMKNKNIDRLFQEKMKNLEVAPNPKVWSAIEGKLQKKKRRVLPFWWLSGSIAAILLLGFFLFPFSSEDDDPMKLKIQKEPSFTKIPQESIPVKKDSSKQPLTPIIKDKAIVLTKPTKKKELHYKKEIKNTPQKKRVMVADNASKIKNPSQKDSSIKTKKEEKLLAHKKNIPSNELNKKSLIAGAPIDTVQEKNSVVKKDFMAVLQKNDSIETIKKTKGQWGLSPVFALLSSNSFTSASPITSDLNSNPIKGENTFSYGAKVTYQLNKKWSLQSGVYFQKSQFLTKNVAVVRSSALPSNVETINFNSSSHVEFNLGDATSLLFLNAMTNNISANDFVTLNNNTNLEQSFGYLEIPFEVKYQFLESKSFQTNIIVGFSSLFLTENQVSTKSQTSTVFLGEANNLNTVNFSGNLGIDIDYRISPSLILNINPMFKGQLNTFSKDSNGFKPYQIGIYTGLKYQF